MTIQEDIQKIIQKTKVEEFQKRVLKKRSWSRKLDADLDPHYWENLKNQLTEPLAKQLVDTFKGLGDQVVEYDERVDQILELLGYKDKTPDFEGIVKDATKPSDKTYWTKLAEIFAHSARDNNTWRDLEDLINIVVNVKKHLGISDPELDNLTTTVSLAMPTKKVGGVDNNLTLAEMINVYKKLGLTNPQEVLGGGAPGIDKLGGSKLSDIPTNLKDLLEKTNKLKEIVQKTGINPTDSNAIQQAEELKNRPTSDNSDKIKGTLGLQPTDSLPNDWPNKLVPKTELDKWNGQNGKFPSKTPEQVEKDIKDLQSKPTGSGTGAALTAEQQQKLNDYEKLEKQKKWLLRYIEKEKSKNQYAQILQEFNKV